MLINIEVLRLRSKDWKSSLSSKMIASNLYLLFLRTVKIKVMFMSSLKC